MSFREASQKTLPPRKGGRWLSGRGPASPGLGPLGPRPDGRDRLQALRPPFVVVCDRASVIPFPVTSLRQLYFKVRAGISLAGLVRCHLLSAVPQQVGATALTEGPRCRAGGWGQHDPPSTPLVSSFGQAAVLSAECLGPAPPKPVCGNLNRPNQEREAVGSLGGGWAPRAEGAED